MSTLTAATARFQDYYWSAWCQLADGYYETRQKTHGSARQAVNEIVAQIVQATKSTVNVRRLSPKVYELVVQNADVSDPRRA